MTNIEFTDRYGGNPPSWLFSCHDNCEAMGVVPYFSNEKMTKEELSRQSCYLTDNNHRSKDNMELHELWLQAEEKEHASDGWHFVKCPACKGTRQVPWYVALGRLPRWITRGVAFVVRNTLRTEMYPPNEPLWDRFKLTMWAAFGSEIGRAFKHIQRKFK